MQVCSVCGLLMTTEGIPDLLFLGIYDCNTDVMLNFPGVLVIIDLPSERILISGGSHYFR